MPLFGDGKPKKTRQEEAQEDFDRRFQQALSTVSGDVDLDRVAKEFALGDSRAFVNHSSNTFLKVIAMCALSIARDVRKMANVSEEKGKVDG